MSAYGKNVFELATKLLDKHSNFLPVHDFKAMLKWTASQVSKVTLSAIFMADLWDNVGVKLWNAATKADKTAAHLLPSWRVFCVALKAQEKFHAKDKGNAIYLPFMAEPQNSLQSEETVSLLVQPLAPAAPLLQLRGKRTPQNP